MSLGPEESYNAEIEIKEFFIGSIFEWHPEVPYANLALKIYPENKNYNENETLSIRFRSPAGTYEPEEIFYDAENKKWFFPESDTKQVKFDYDSWWFPLSEYKTIIFIENNISVIVNQSLEIPNSEFLSGHAINSTHEGIKVIEIRIFQNWISYVVLSLILIIFYVPLVYSFYRVKKKIPSFIYLFQLIPIGAIFFIKDLIPFKSILFFVLILSIIFFWIYYFSQKK